MSLLPFCGIDSLPDRISGKTIEKVRIVLLAASVGLSGGIRDNASGWSTIDSLYLPLFPRKNSCIIVRHSEATVRNFSILGRS
jgi:hypothetical protein